MIKTIIKYLTPFIVSFIDVINGVCLYIQYILNINIDERFYPTFSHSSGSSVLLIAFVIAMTKDMCKFYKASCYGLLIMHIISLIYTWTPITIVVYIYIFIIFSLLSLIGITIAILGYKVHTMINWVGKHLRVK